MQQKVCDILGRWQRATEEEVTFVKHTLMPEDDSNLITLKVTEHPDICGNEIIIKWFDIDVFEDTRMIGHITVETTDGTLTYDFL